MAAESNIDAIVRSVFFPDPGVKGVIVDVGAARPSYLSNSESFRGLGWKVIAIEPIPAFCAEHRAAGYEVLEYACSDEDIDDAPFSVVNLNNAAYRGGHVSFESFSSLGIPKSYDAALDSIKAWTNAEKTTISVKVRRLDRILAEHAPDVTEIDILTADVEGWELSVMRGLSMDRYRPKVVILENQSDDEGYRAFMAERGYWICGRIDYNEVYVRSAWCVPGSRALPVTETRSKSQSALDPQQWRVPALLREMFFSDKQGPGIVIDVGAARPSSLSSSESFRKWGWKVIAVEPNPFFCAEHRARGYDVLEYACGDRNADGVPFHLVKLNNLLYRGNSVSYELFSSLGITKGFEREIERRQAAGPVEKITMPVKVRTLDTLLADHAPDLKEIDIIAVDVEGWELPVMRGISLDRHKPKVVVLENVYNDEFYRTFMSERGYWLGGRVEYDEIFVRSDWCAPGTRTVSRPT